MLAAGLEVPFPLSKGWRPSLSKPVQTQSQLASIDCCLCFCGHPRSLALWWERTFRPDNELLPGWVVEVRLGIQTELRAGREMIEELELGAELWL